MPNEYQLFISPFVQSNDVSFPKALKCRTNKKMHPVLTYRVPPDRLYRAHGEAAMCNDEKDKSGHCSHVQKPSGSLATEILMRSREQTGGGAPGWAGDIGPKTATSPLL
jgi:hypothetical protein